MKKNTNHFIFIYISTLKRILNIQWPMYFNKWTNFNNKINQSFNEI